MEKGLRRDSANFRHLIFDARSANVPDAIAALKTHKCIQLKNAIDPAFLRQERRRIFAQARTNGSLQPPRCLYYPINDSNTPISYPLINLLRSKPLFPIVAGALDTQELSLPALYCSALRHVSNVSPDENGHFLAEPMAEPFHQDSRCCPLDTYGPMMIVWLLLSPDLAGADVAPSLTFLPGSRDELLPTEPNSIYPYKNNLELSNQALEGASLWTPDVELGDALVFTGMCPHKTHMSAAMDRARLSCELKFFPNSSVIRDRYYPINHLNSEHFIITERFSVGPTGILGIGSDADRRTAMKSGGLEEIHSLNLDFSYSRVPDSQTFPVAGATLARNQSKALIALVGNEQSMCKRMFDTIGSEKVGREVVLDPWSAVNNGVSLSDKIVFGGHVFGIHDFLDCDAVYVTSVANPLKRMFEELCLGIDTPTEKAMLERMEEIEIPNMLTDSFAFYAHQKRDFITDQPNHEIDKNEPITTRLERAIDNIKQHFDFVGLNDQFALSVFLMAAHFGSDEVQLPLLPVMAENEFDDRIIPKRIRMKLKMALAPDLEVYEVCRSRFDGLAAAYDFGEPLAAYKADLNRMNELRTQMVAAVEAQRHNRDFLHFLQELNDLKAGNADTSESDLVIEWLLSTWLDNKSANNWFAMALERADNLERLVNAQNVKIARMEKTNAELLRQSLTRSGLSSLSGNPNHSPSQQDTFIGPGKPA